MTTLGERLKEVRGELGLSQTAFAAIGGVQKRAQINYEQDERAPDAAYLKAIADHGVDVRYIVTGERMTPEQIELERRLRMVRKATAATVSIPGLTTQQQASVQAAIFAAELSSLADDEQALMGDYRRCNKPQQELIRQTAANFVAANSHAPQPRKKRGTHDKNED